MPQLEQEIIDSIAEEGYIDRDVIKPETNLFDLGIDSLTALQILVVLENKYDIVITPDRLKNVNNVGEIISAISAELQKKTKGPAGQETAG